MKIRLQEIELGAKNLADSKKFYTSILGLNTAVDQNNLNVFESGIEGLDFNTSTHYTPGITVISFLTDDLQEIMERLKANSILFDGPKKSHLGMTTIEFNDPDGYLIRVNRATKESPDRLKV